MGRRQVVSLLFFVVIVGLGLQSCDTTSPEQAGEVWPSGKMTHGQLMGLIDSAGALHNGLLAAAFPYVAGGALNPDTASGPMIVFTQDYFSTNCTTRDVSSYLYLVPDFADTMMVEIDPYDFIDTVSQLGVGGRSILTRAFDAQGSYMDSALTLAQFVDSCNALIAESVLLSTDEEALICGVTVSIMKSSAVYWDSQFDNWETLINRVELEGTPMSKVWGMNKKQKKILIADAVGATRGVIVGAITGGPIGAFIGGMISGGTSSLWQGVYRAIRG